MDTREVAQYLETTPRLLRQFLRSSMSTFVAVGSGARYDFNDQDLSTLGKRFDEWKGAGKPKPEGTKRLKPKPKGKADKQRERDVAEWESEGPVVLEDIRDPRVRARVKERAAAQEHALDLLLLAAGEHITQKGDRKPKVRAS